MTDNGLIIFFMIDEDINECGNAAKAKV